MVCLSKIAVVLAALPAASAAAMAANHDVVGGDITGGTLAKPGTFPFIVAPSLNGSIGCGGTLLNANTIVTAAHCTHGLKDFQLSWFRVRAGSLDKNSGGVDVGVCQILEHPSYVDVTKENDIALWRLCSPIGQSSAIRYATLPPQAQGPGIPAVGTKITVAGWGLTDNTSGNLPTKLRQITDIVEPHEACETELGPLNTTMFCVGYVPGGAQGDACYGDSGGPAIDARSGVFVGIVSFGSRLCDQPASHDVYTRVSNYVDWIKAHQF